MSAAAVKQEENINSLLSKADETVNFPGLVKIGERVARGLRQIIADFGCNDILVNSQPAQAMRFDAFCKDAGDFGAYCRYRLDPIKGNVLMTLTPALVQQLVDIFYGGFGEANFKRSEFTVAEKRFVERIGEQTMPLFHAAWTDVVDLNPQFLGVENDITETSFAKDSDMVVVHPFKVQGGPIKPVTINIVYLASALRSFQALSNTAQRELAKPVDQVWQDNLRDAVMQVRLPIRSIFARPELSVSKLLNLKTDDIIPICLPNHLPITVAGRLFAQSTVGESNGRAAIRIEKIEEGNSEDE